MIFLIISILLHETSIWDNRKIELNIWYRNLVYNYRGQRFPVVLDRFAHTAAGILAAPPYRSSPDLSGFGAVAGQHEFQLPPWIFYWVQVWRLARPLQDLEMLLTSQLLFPCLCVCCVERQPRPIFNVLTEGRRLLAKMLWYMAPSVLPSIWCSCHVPFARSTPKHDVSTPMLHGWDGVLGIVLILLPPNTASGVYTKSSILVSSDHMTSPMPPLDHPDGLWQSSDRPGHVLSWAGGPLVRCRILIHDCVVCY